MTKVLVTGGAGFIGSHTCLNLAENGFEVYVVDSLINGFVESINRVNQYCKKKGFKEVKFFNINLCDFETFESFFCEIYSQKIKFDGVIHFAGLKSVAHSIENPILYWSNNINSTLNLLKLMSNFDIDSLVFSSSATVYGYDNKSPLSENASTNPINPYGDTKLVIEKILKQYIKSSSRKLKIASLRYFNPVGANKFSIIGECNKEVANNLFPILCNVAYGDINSLTIFGNDWPTKDGTCIRDYIHVEDLSEAHTKALKYLFSKNEVNTILNLGTGKGTSILELINIFQEVNKVKINYKFGKRRIGDIAEVFADTNLANITIDWKAKRDLKNMCIDGWNWKKNNPYGFLN